MTVALPARHGALIPYCGVYCVRAYAAGDPAAVVPFVVRGPDCAWCAGCGRRLDLNGDACAIHGGLCFREPRLFLQTAAAAQFCGIYLAVHGVPLEIGRSEVWRRAMALWYSAEMSGADGLELYDRVMNVQD